MSDICHADFCDGVEDDSGDCQVCGNYYERMMGQFGAPPKRYTPEELADVYSDPTDRHKLISLIGEQS